MKVDNPRFLSCGEVDCCDCPFKEKPELCNTHFHSRRCPREETYVEACALAEKEATK